MKNKISFSDQYRHPEWQKKRLEALAVAEFSCQRCCDKESQLHVHHKRYVKNRMIWEYSVNELEVLCEECHQYAHIEKDIFQDFLARFPSESIGDFFSLLLGFSSKVNGPAGCGNAEDLMFSVENSYQMEIGIIAAILSNRGNINTIISLHKLLIETPNGSPITFTLPVNRGYQSDEGL